MIILRGIRVSQLSFAWAVVTALVILAGPAQSGKPSKSLTVSHGPIVINGQKDVVISGVTITSNSGPCIQVINSSNVTIKSSRIGPCGKDKDPTKSWGIYVSGGSGINIFDNYVHVDNLASNCDNSHVGIFVDNSSGVAMQGNVVAYGEKNILLWNSYNVSVTGNFLLNPRGAAGCINPDNLGGHQFQSWANDATPNQNVTVTDNYVLNSADTTLFSYPGRVSDSISFGVTNDITASNNYVAGGWYKNGCGIIADYKAKGAKFLNNVLSDNFGCGIGIASGTAHTVSGNKILLLQPSAPSAAGLTITSGAPCGPISISNNIAYAIQSGGWWVQGYWSAGNCTSVTLSDNTFDVGCTTGVNCAAFSRLYPVSWSNPPPRIPPKPKACVAPSPYSNQTGAPAC
jgi:hypothetical protein